MDMTKDEQLEIYGQVLDGKESDLEKDKLLRIQYLKTKLRRLLDYEAFGDGKDISTDIAKGLALGMGIALGLVTDKAVIDAYKALTAAQLSLYGNPADIVASLRGQAETLAVLLDRYYQAKKTILAAVDAEAVQAADIEDKAAD